MTLNNHAQKLTDEELVSLSLENKEMFGQLIHRYQEKLSRYLKRVSNFSIEEIDDILQDIFIKVYKNLNDFDLSLKFSSWIYRIAHNEMINHFRKKKARPEYTPGEENEKILKNLVFDINLEKKLDDSYLADNVFKALNNLNNKYKEILILKYWEEKSYQEISDILKKPMGTVATLLNRAKKEFKKNWQINNLKKYESKKY